MPKKSSKSYASPRDQQPLPTNFPSVPGYAVIIKVLKSIVAYIVQEIIDTMMSALKAQGKSFSAGALDEWRDKLSDAVFTKLLKGGNWSDDKADVLTVASDMAVIAGILSGSSSTVNKSRVHAAFRACKDHAACPGNLGSGRWCDFDI